MQVFVQDLAPGVFTYAPPVGQLMRALVALDDALNALARVDAEKSRSPRCALAMA